MIIYLRHRNSDLTVETNSDDPDETIDITIDAEVEVLEDYLESLLVEELENTYGFHGHSIDLEDTTNLDLYAACLTLSSFKVITVDLLPEALKLPPGSLS